MYCYAYMSGRIAQLVRAPPLQGGGRGFKSLSAHTNAYKSGFARVLSRIHDLLAAATDRRPSSRLQAIDDDNVLVAWYQHLHRLLLLLCSPDSERCSLIIIAKYPQMSSCLHLQPISLIIQV